MINTLKNFFHHSETILWARIQMLFGIVWMVLSTADLAPIINDPKILTYWAIANGVITEWLRRRGTETQSILVNPDAPADEAPVVATILSNPMVAPLPVLPPEPLSIHGDVPTVAEVLSTKDPRT